MKLNIYKLQNFIIPKWMLYLSFSVAFLLEFVMFLFSYFQTKVVSDWFFFIYKT
jgi:hypothetical protein